MNEQHEFNIESSGARLDRALAALLPDLSRAHLQRLIKEGLVSVREQTITKPSYRLESGDTLTVIIPPPKAQPLVAEPMALDIIYQDEALVVVNKPAGLVVHPAAGHHQGTLVNALLALYPKLALVGGERRPGIVHRLDKDTSGLIAVALTEPARLTLKKQFQERQVEKQYLALVDGVVDPPLGIIDAAIGRSKRDRKRMAVVANGRESRTFYETLERFDNHTLLEASPKTGRTHQIRVHLAFLGYPLVSDPVYGRRKRSVPPLKRHFLHAHRLSLIHPVTGEPLSFEAPLPGDLKHALNWVRQIQT